MTSTEGDKTLKKHSNEIIEYKVTKHVVCNMCTKVIDVSSNRYLDNYISIEKNWQYGSPYDGEQHTIDLCSDCYDILLGQLKISPGDNTKELVLVENLKDAN